MLLVWQMTTLEQKVNQMKILTHFIAAIMTLFVMSTAAQAEDFDISSHGDWKVKLYMGSNDTASCDLYTIVDDVQLTLEFWSDSDVSLVLHLFGNELEPVPSNIDLHFKIDRASPFSFTSARNHGQYITFTHNSTSTIWGNLLKEMSSGQRLYFLDQNRKPMSPSFSLRGTSRAIADWKECIKRLSHV